jgi:hypothetical protein
VDRRNLVPAVAVAITIVCALAIYLNMQRRPGPVQTTVIVGSAQPSAGSSSDSPLGPHLDQDTGVLTIQAGDQVDSNGVLVGVTGVVAPFNTSDPSRQPSSGEFMLVNISVHNSLSQGGEVLTVSPAANFELQDTAGKVYPSTALPGAPSPPDGRLNPGATVNGGLTYDVPKGLSYRLLFKSPLVSNGEIIIDLGRQ